MLIRSQDKIDLLNVDNVFNIEVAFEDSTDGDGDGLWHLEAIQNPEDYDVISIGAYSSKEKALKVMNMIEKSFSRSESNELSTGEAIDYYTDIFYKKYSVFHMPQDKEVEA